MMLCPNIGEFIKHLGQKIVVYQNESIV